MVHPVGTTKNGIEVVVDLIRSKAAVQIAQQPYLLVLLREVLQNTAFRESEVSGQHDMKRAIGYDFVISTSEKDTVFYAKPLRDDVYARFVKSGKPVPTQRLVIIMSRNKTGEYELQDTWIGHISPPRPGSENETPESKSYWSTHAIIADNQAVQSRTITKICPY